MHASIGLSLFGHLPPQGKGISSKPTHESNMQAVRDVNKIKAMEQLKDICNQVNSGVYTKENKIACISAFIDVHKATLELKDKQAIFGMIARRVANGLGVSSSVFLTTNYPRGMIFGWMMLLNKFGKTPTTPAELNAYLKAEEFTSNDAIILHDAAKNPPGHNEVQQYITAYANLPKDTTIISRGKYFLQNQHYTYAKVKSQQLNGAGSANNHAANQDEIVAGFKENSKCNVHKPPTVADVIKNIQEKRVYYPININKLQNNLVQLAELVHILPDNLIESNETYQLLSDFIELAHAGAAFDKVYAASGRPKAGDDKVNEIYPSMINFFAANGKKILIIGGHRTSNNQMGNTIEDYGIKDMEQIKLLNLPEVECAADYKLDLGSSQINLKTAIPEDFDVIVFENLPYWPLSTRPFMANVHQLLTKFNSPLKPHGLLITKGLSLNGAMKQAMVNNLKDNLGIINEQRKVGRLHINASSWALLEEVENNRRFGNAVAAKITTAELIDIYRQLKWEVPYQANRDNLQKKYQKLVKVSPEISIYAPYFDQALKN